MRWPNGGPPKLYVIIKNQEYGHMETFTRKQERTEWLKTEHDTYPDGMYTFLTYVQEAKK